MIQRRTLVKAVIAALAPLSMTSAFAAGGPSGAHIGYQHQGQLGAVDMNPYKIAPLTAIIRDAGFTIQNIHVRIVPKANGQEIAYKVTNQKAKTYGGIPVFGLYPDYVNTVEVSYTKVAGDKREEIKESYRIYAPPVYFYATGARDQKNMDMNPEVKNVAFGYVHDPKVGFARAGHLINVAGFCAQHGRLRSRAFLHLHGTGEDLTVEHIAHRGETLFGHRINRQNVHLVGFAV